MSKYSREIVELESKIAHMTYDRDELTHQISTLTVQVEHLRRKKLEEQATVTLDRAALQRILKIGVLDGEYTLGNATQRLTYMRDALQGAMQGDLTILADIERVLAQQAEAEPDPWRNNPKARPMKHPGSP